MKPSLSWIIVFALSWSLLKQLNIVVVALLETWSDRSKAYYIEEDHGEEEETAGDAVDNQSRGGVGEEIVRHVGVTSSDKNTNKLHIPTGIYWPL